VFSVRYELNLYMLYRRNSVFKGLVSETKFHTHTGPCAYLPESETPGGGLSLRLGLLGNEVLCRQPAVWDQYGASETRITVRTVIKPECTGTRLMNCHRGRSERISVSRLNDRSVPVFLWLRNKLTQSQGQSRWLSSTIATVWDFSLLKQSGNYMYRLL
jgi:hypothetical protein